MNSKYCAVMSSMSCRHSILLIVVSDCTQVYRILSWKYQSW